MGKVKASDILPFESIASIATINLYKQREYLGTRSRFIKFDRITIEKKKLKTYLKRNNDESTS